jgi:amino acid adenylation domain-containing protein
MGVLAGFQALVHRYTGQEDICLGSVVAGRTRVETEDLIGFFVNTLVFRTDFAGDPTVRELLERVRQSSVEAFAHQALPFERLVEELGPERSLDRAPVVQVVLAFQDAGWSEVALADLRATPVPIDTVTAKFDLSLSVTSTGAGLATRLEYSTDLFLPATAARLLGHLETLLGGMVASPDARVSRLPLLTEHERRQVVVEWNASRRPVPGDCGVAALFEAAAARDPDAVAVESADRTLTYRELNGEANRLARHLRLRGVAPGALVGVSLERSTDFVVTVLAILKAGGAYVPIDPGFPADRQAFVLADTRATALVTRREHGAPDAAVGPPVVWLDADADGIDGESDADLGIVVSGEDLAYVMYTSGSTGQPKGVMIPHRAIARLVLNTDYVTLTPADVVGHASNVAFDAATFEIWGALLNGARLAILDRDTVLSPRDLGIALRRHGVTILFLTTALFNQVAQEAPGELAGLRTLLVGGEALDPRWVARQLESAAPGRFLNAYGPTETTTFATWHLVQSVAPDAVTLPIGRPIANTEVYILDRHLAPVPIGVAGELCIGGPGLARGYLNQPELTAQKFVPHPFAAEPGARLYRTGDLARWRADGTVDFIGRLDDQVKIRGHRVEPGEVETALGRHAKVRESVVVAEVDRAGSRRLVAYVVAEGPTPPAPRELRAFLRQSLPEWMVPAAFVFLPVLPVTANGKVDRARLPSPAGPAGGDAPEASGPRDALEIQLTRIWEDVLGTTPIGIHDNFFDLGGHSLLAMRLFARIESALGKPLPLATLFKTPTVAELADVIRAEGWWMFGSSLVGIQTRGARPPLFALPGHDGNLLTYADLGRLLGDEQPFYGLQARGLDGRSPPIARVEAMAAHYLEELRRVQPQGPYYLLGACMGAVVAFEMAQQLHRTGERVALLALLEPSRPGWRPARPFRAGLPPWLVVPRFFLGRVGLHARTIAGLGAAARRAYLRERLRMVGEMVAHRDVFRGDRSEIYQMHVSEASKRALRRYAPRRYPGSVTVFLTAGQQAHRPLAWTAFVQGDLELQEVPGRDLHGMLTEPHVRTLATRLEACLRRARSE